jgi:hypothetical protein
MTREANFVHLRHGQINMDHVRRFEYIDAHQVRVWWANGDDEVLACSGPLSSERYYIVPAGPGFDLLYFYFDVVEDGVEETFERTPVVAWRIGECHTKECFSDESIIAISTHLTSADDAGNMRVAVRHPDGVVSHYADGRVWPDIQEWMAWAREDWRRAEEERTKEAAE